MLPAIIIDHRREIDALCRAHYVRRLELFGSAATEGWDPASSDLDFLVKFDAEAQFTSMATLKMRCGNSLMRDVDLILRWRVQKPVFPASG